MNDAKKVLDTIPANRYIQLFDPEIQINTAKQEFIAADNVGGGSVALTGSITRTIGTGQDHTTFQDFAAWVEANTFYNAKIKATVVAGNYTVNESLFDWELPSMGIAEMFIEGIGNGHNECIITTGDNNVMTFRGGRALVHKLRFISSGNYSNCLRFYDSSVDCLLIYGVEQAYGIYAQRCSIEITNCNYSDSTGEGGYIIYLRNCCIGSVDVVIDGVSQDPTGIRVSDGVMLRKVAGSITNCGTAIRLTNELNQVVLASSLTLTGNSSDFNIPINEIQYNGSYITWDNAPLTLKA